MPDKPKIDHYKGICNTPANIYAMQAHCELILDGLADNVQLLNWSDNAITASLDGAVVGVLVWDKQEWTKTFVIKLAWVSRGFRRQGIYSMLWNEAVKLAREEKLLSIDGATSVKNKAMRAFAASRGRKEYAVLMRYIIEPAENSVPE